jgi:hypothetical protein
LARAQNARIWKPGSPIESKAEGAHNGGSVRVLLGQLYHSV